MSSTWCSITSFLHTNTSNLSAYAESAKQEEKKQQPAFKFNNKRKDSALAKHTRGAGEPLNSRNISRLERGILSCVFHSFPQLWEVLTGCFPQNEKDYFVYCKLLRKFHNGCSLWNQLCQFKLLLKCQVWLTISYWYWCHLCAVCTHVAQDWF